MPHKTQVGVVSGQQSGILLFILAALTFNLGGDSLVLTPELLR